MSKPVIYAGTIPTLSVAFTDKTGAAIDPSTISFKCKKPDASVTTYVYGTDSELVRDSTGAYHVDFLVDLAGSYEFGFQGTGAAQTVGDQTFVVKPSLF